ncbi:hypothetical protein MY5147_007564 [Beauveria neobassiana]
MGISYDALSDNLRDWALRQSVFFVASAPLRGRHINVSPKGLPESSLAVLGPNQVAYVDSMGSGCETICHVRENGRVTMLFCSFDKTPRILRLYCTGSVTESDRPEFHTWLQKMGDKELVGARAVIVLNIFKVQVSCGFGVPLLALDSDPTLDEPKPCLLTRPRLEEFARYAVDRGQTLEHQQKWNSSSLDVAAASREDMKRFFRGLQKYSKTSGARITEVHPTNLAWWTFSSPDGYNVRSLAIAIYRDNPSWYNNVQELTDSFGKITVTVLDDAGGRNWPIFPTQDVSLKDF